MTSFNPDGEKNRFISSFPKPQKAAGGRLYPAGLQKLRDLNVFRNIDLTIHRGEKIALVGVNGAGKSTLARILSGTEEPSSGAVHYGLNVSMAFFSQESAQNLNYQRTVWDEVRITEHAAMTRERRNLLGAFLFSGDDVYKEISVLSGGEKSRLAC